jgi:hypothetical protein
MTSAIDLAIGESVEVELGDGSAYLVVRLKTASPVRKMGISGDKARMLVEIERTECR